MKSVKEVSKLTGVSVRTLHYYDNIGLLKPTRKNDAGYRYYDNKAICRLQTILMFRELEFALKDIKIILDNPNFDLKSAISEQIKILELQKEHLNSLITFANNIITKGATNMDFKAFDKTKINEYKQEVKQKWGNTQAFAEYESKNNSQTDQNQIADKLMEQFKFLGQIKDLSPSSDKAQSAIASLQKYITENYYTCTNDILKSLGEMYVGDERFKNNIDSVGGDGTAKFTNDAIKFYCNKS